MRVSYFPRKYRSPWMIVGEVTRRIGRAGVNRANRRSEVRVVTHLCKRRLGKEREPADVIIRPVEVAAVKETVGRVRLDEQALTALDEPKPHGAVDRGTALLYHGTHRCCQPRSAHEVRAMMLARRGALGHRRRGGDPWRPGGRQTGTAELRSAVMLVGAGFGGTAGAPIARDVLHAALSGSLTRRGDGPHDTTVLVRSRHVALASPAGRVRRTRGRSPAHTSTHLPGRARRDVAAEDGVDSRTRFPSSFGAGSRAVRVVWALAR